MAWICDKNGNHRCEIKKLTYNGTFMEVSSITVTVESPAPIAFAIGDYIDWDYDGLRYTLDTAAGVEKQATRNSVGNAFIYENLVFLSPLKAAENADFFDVILDNTNDFLTNAEFSFYGTAWDYAKRLEANLCRVYGSDTWKVRIWTSGTCYDETPATGLDTGAWENKLVDVAGIKCLGGFQQIYDLWGCAYVFSVMSGVNYVDFYDDFEQYAKAWQAGGVDKIFAYGKGNGLYKIRHTPDADHVLVTRLRPYGSGDNLPPNYYLNSEDYHVDGNESSELAISHLMLPASQWTKDGVKHPANAFLEQNTDLYGVREGVVLWDGSDPELGEIKPSIYGLTIQDLLNLMASGDSYRPDEAKWPDTTQRIDKIITGAAPTDNGVKNEAGYDFTEVESGGSLAEHSFGTGGAYIDVEFNDLVMGTTPSVSHLAEFRIVPTSENKVAASFDVQASVASAIRAVNAYLTPYVGGVKISDATYPCTVTEEAISNTVEGITYTKRYKISLLDSTGNPIVFSSMYTGDVTFRIVAHIDFIGNPTGFPVVRNEYAVSFNLLRGNKAIDEYFSVTIPQIGFDLSAAVANGAKLCMRSGANQPREFQIIPSSVRYLPDTDTWFVRCKRSVDQSISTYFPNSNSVITAGDEYYFTGIAMPPLYVEIAAQKLLTAATAWLALHSKPRMLSAVDVDNKIMAVEEIVLKEGMSLPLSDTDLGITPQNQESRVIDNIRIEEGSDPIRTFTITLRDKKEKSSLDAAIRGATSNLATNASVSEAVNAATGTGHGSLTGRDMPNQHPISAITGLEEALLSSGFFEYDPVSDVVKLKSDYDYLGPKKGLIFTENAEENTPAELMKVNVGTAQNPVWAIRSRLPFFSDSWVSAGGVSDGGGSSAVDLQAVWESLEGNDGYGAGRVIDPHHIPVATSDAVGGIKIGYEENGRNYAVKLSDGKAYVTIPWVDQEPIAPLADAIGDVKTAVKGIGESIVDLSMNVDGLHAGLMELADEDLALLERIETLADYFDASGNAKSALKLTTTGPLNIWGVQFWNNGIPNAVTDQPYLYIAQTRVKTSAANDTLLGIDAISNASSSGSSDQSRIVWEPNAGGTGIGAWHFLGNVYADGWVSAGGLSSGGGQAAGNASLSNVTTLAHGQTGELSASSVGTLVLYDKDAIDYMIENAGQVKKVAGISPDSIGDIPAASLASALGLADSAYRAVASTIGSGVAALVPGSLIQSVLGDGTWDSTHTVKAFVNSSIATATATYRGSYNLVSDLSLTTSATQAQIATALASAISTADNNDYCYVQIPTSDSTPTEIAHVDRYKHNGTAWSYEYTLNNSGYTAAQWAAINSGITTAKRQGYDTIVGYFSSGILSYNHGGTGLSSYAKGDLIYASAANTLAKLAANSTATKKFLSMTSSVPSWDTVAFGDLPDMYIGNAKVKSSAQTAQDIGGLGSITASGLIKTTNFVQATRFYLSDSVYFVLDANGVKLEGAGFYTDSFVSAGGLSTGGGATGATLEAVWKTLINDSSDHTYDSTLIDGAHIPDMASTYGYIKSVSLAEGATNGTIHIVIDGTAGSDVAVHGLGTAAYANTTAFAAATHSHAISQITDFPTTWAWENIAGAPSTMPNPAALTFGTKTYDGSVAKTITASDLGALTSVAFSDLTSHPTNLSGYGITDAQPLDADLTAIAGLTGTSGLLKKTAANTWTLDTNTYLTASTVPAATSSAYGGIKIGYTESLENYAVQLSSGKAYVHVADSIPYADAIGDVKTAIKGLDEALADLSMDIDSINALLSNPTIEALEFKLFGGAPVMTWDEANQAWHLNGNFYADGFVSAGGVSNGGGSGGADLNAVWASLTTNTDSHGTDKIHTAHIPDMKDVYGYATQTWVGQQNYLTGNQTITLSGDVSGSGTTSISVTIGTKKVAKSMLAQGVQDSLGKADTALQISGGTMTGTLSFADNVGITASMGGGTDGWGIVGTGSEDNGRLKIYVADNGTSDWMDFEFRDYGGTTYTPLSMTGDQVLFSVNPSVSGNAILHAGNYSSYALPLSGGTLTGNLTIKYAQLRFQSSSGTDIGYLSVDAHDNPIWLNCSDNAWYNILHSNNYSSYALPLAGGTMTGLLKIATGSGIEDATGNGMLCYHPSSWTGVSSSQWGVGAVDSQGVIRSSNSNLIHSRAGSDSTIFDSGNSNKSDVPWTCSYLTVNANAQTSYRAYVNGVIASTGDQIITSDETKKTNLEDIRLSVRDIASVRAVTYDLKADGSHSFGTIAQDWLGILPEAVLGEEGDYSFAYAQAAMVSSIINARAIVDLENHETEQDKEIKRLRKRVSDLETEIKRLRAN